MFWHEANVIFGQELISWEWFWMCIAIHCQNRSVWGIVVDKVGQRKIQLHKFTLRWSFRFEQKYHASVIWQFFQSFRSKIYCSLYENISLFISICSLFRTAHWSHDSCPINALNEKMNNMISKFSVFILVIHPAVIPYL